ncbi:MAG: hypothetical protein ACE5FC_05660 [Myxococcota bacterium]
MDLLADFTDYVSGSGLIEDLGNPWVQTAILALFIVSILGKYRVVFTVLIVLTFTLFVIRVGFGGEAIGVVEQAPVFLSGLGLVIIMAFYLFYVRR